MNEMMRRIVAVAEVDPRPGRLSRENRRRLRAGVVMVGSQIALAKDERSRRGLIERWAGSGPGWSDAEMELSDNDFHLETRTPFGDPNWRVKILDQGMQVVRQLADKVRAVTSLPVQVVLSINSGFEEDPEEGSDSTSGNVKFFLLRAQESMDHSKHVSSYAQPIAVFTLHVTKSSP